MDDLQPQDLSTCSIPSSVVDLTRGAEATSLEAVRMVSPRWYPDTTGRTGLPLTDGGGAEDDAAASSDIGVQSRDRIPADDAFSNTTVTLSYVSRSRVFSSQDPLSTHSSLYGVPSIGKFSLQSSCESEKGLGEAGYALGQHYLQHSDGPLDLATRTQLFQALAQVGGEKDPESQLCLTQPGSRGLNGGVADSGLNLENELPSLGGEYSLEDPGCASATSPDSVPCPQASRPPSTVNSYPEEANEVTSRDMLDTENPVEPLPSQQAESSGDRTPRLEKSTEPTSSPAHKCKVAPRPTGELTDHGEFLKEVSARKPQKTAKVESAVVPHINGNAKTLPGNSPPRRKLPERLGRGTRLEAFVLNLCPRAYRVAKCVGKTTLKATKKTAVPSNSSSPPGKEDHSIGGQKKAPALAKAKRKAASPSKAGKTDHVITDNCKDSTSDCEIFNNSKNLHNGTPSKKAASRFSTQGKSKRVSPVKSDPGVTALQELNLEPGEIAFPDALPELKVQTLTKSPKKSPSVSKGTATGSSISPVKAVRPPKRRQRTPPGGLLPSMFSPQEPEIKLKYVNYKEERRDPRLDSFSPFVRTHRQPSSSSCLYTVINYAEEDVTRRGGLAPGSPGSFLSGATPGTSCLRPGRVSVHGQHRRPLVCCLCGASANVTGLGDLHGPYYPNSYRPGGKTKASESSPKTNADEEGGGGGGGGDSDSCDSDSSVSSCSMQGAGGRQRARPPPGAWPQRGGIHLQQKGSSGSPASKRARMDTGGVLEEEEVDWYSPPVVPQESCEYWLHEDCSVWAAGVFLVKGKVYGLEEAVKVAQATTCSCCRTPGATLGCLSKGCPNKYHYRCAVASDCALVEENFSMKCKKHKNKSLKSPSGNRRRDGR